jgi:molecular chaperone GrpE
VTHHHSGKHESKPNAVGSSPADAETSANASAESAASATAGKENPATTTSADSATQATIKKLQAEVASLKDRELRVRAELDNYRKRATRELDDSLRYANMPILRDLLPVLDNIERAIQAAEKNADVAALLEGVKMMQQQLAELLQRHHCEQINALHTPFDPNLHHAIMQQPSEEFPANTVVMVTQNGYQLHDRVVRPSQVIVSTAK